MERRSHERVPLAFPIRLRIGNINDFTEEYSMDLSAGGIFIHMNYPPPIGTKVKVEFFLEPVQKTIEAAGSVVRSIPEGGEGNSPPGMGVQFTEIGIEAKRFIELVVGKHNRSHPSQELELPEGFIEGVDEEIASRSGPTAGAANLEIRLKLPDTERFLRTHSETLRKGEMFIKVPNPRPVGTQVHLHVLLQKENRWVTAIGEVIGTTTSGGEDGNLRPPGMMVAIREPSPEFRQLMEAKVPT